MLGELRAANRRGLARSVLGGATSAIASIALILAPGLIAFQPLGASFFAHAAAAGLMAAIVGNAVSSAFGERPASISGPSSTSCLVVAAFLATLLRSDPELPASTLVGLVSLCIVAAGLLQIGFAAVRMGTIVRFVPYPVVAGYSAGIGLLIAMSQMPALLGVPHLDSLMTEGLSSARWLALVPALTCMALTWLIERTRPSWPASLLALAAGILTDWLLESFVGRAALGPTIGSLGVVLDYGTLQGRLEQGALAAMGVKHVGAFVTFAITLAIIASMDSLLNASAVENLTLARSNPNRQLWAQGLGNIASGLVGGTPITLSRIRVLLAWRLGGDSRLTGVVYSAAVIVAIVAGAGVLSRLPLSVLAGVMLWIAWDLVDPWLRTTVRLMLRNRSPLGDTAWDVGVAALVMLTLACFDFVAAIAVGMVSSLVLFVRAANRNVVRYVGGAIPSRYMRPIEQVLYLHTQRDRVAVIGLQGPLFFGTTEAVARRVAKLAPHVQFVLLDLRRVTSIDVTAFFVLSRMAAELKRDGRALLIAQIEPQRCSELAHAVTLSRIWKAARRFRDRDAALEWVERQLLAERFANDDQRDLALSETDLARGLTPAQAETLARRTRTEHLPVGAVVFRAGSGGADLFIILRGRVSMRAVVAGHDQRLVTFGPGLSFGEPAAIDGSPRTASAVCDTDAVIAILRWDDLSFLRLHEPSVYARILENIVRSLSHRLRATTEMLGEGAEIGDELTGAPRGGADPN